MRLPNMDLAGLTAWIDKRHSELSAVVSLAPNPEFAAINEQVARKIDRIVPRKVAS